MEKTVASLQAFLSFLPRVPHMLLRTQFPPSPSPFNGCHTGYTSPCMSCKGVPSPLPPRYYDLFSDQWIPVNMVSKFQKTYFWAVKVIKLTVNVQSYPKDAENNLLVRADSFNGLRYCIYSIYHPGLLLNFWTLRVGAISRLGAY